MVIASPGEVAFFIFNFPIYWYGIILAFAVFVGVACAEILARKFSVLPHNFFIDNSPLVIICGIVGARIYYCFVNFNYYIKHPFEIIDIRQGGLSVHGMIFAGVIAVYFLAKKYRVSILAILDVLVCPVILAQAIGRWGNFFNSEAFGYPTNADWGVYIPVSHRPLAYINYDLFHPAFIYESFLDFAAFFILFFIFRKMPEGVTFFSYLILYSIIRIIVENFRIDSVLNIASIPVAQWVSCFFILVSVCGLIALACSKNS